MPIFNFECPLGHQFEQYLYQRNEANPLCSQCQNPTERVWGLTKRNGYQAFPFTTTHITGEVLEVRSPQHLKELEKIHNVRLRDDVAYTTQEYEGYDWGTRKQRYKENGAGLPGCWI